MKKVVVCIGSSCHLKGSRQVVERLQELFAHCQTGVCVKVNETLFSVSPETVDSFFQKEVMGK